MTTPDPSPGERPPMSPREAAEQLREFVDYVAARGAYGYACTWVHGSPVTIPLDVLRVLARTPAGDRDRGPTLDVDRLTDDVLDAWTEDGLDVDDDAVRYALARSAVAAVTVPRDADGHPDPDGHHARTAPAAPDRGRELAERIEALLRNTARGYSEDGRCWWVRDDAGSEWQLPTLTDAQYARYLARALTPSAPTPTDRGRELAEIGDRAEAGSDLMEAARALVALDDNPMTCAPGGELFSEAIDAIRRALASPAPTVTREAVIEAVQRVDVIERDDIEGWRPASPDEARAIADALDLTEGDDRG